MQATLYCKSNFLIFLNDKDELIGYQLDVSALKALPSYKIEFPTVYPTNTKKTLVLNGVSAIIVYEKTSIGAEEAKIIAYRVNGEMTNLEKLIKHNLSQSIQVTTGDEPCAGFLPRADYGMAGYMGEDCDCCQNAVFCN